MNRATKRRLRKLTTQAARMLLKGNIDGAVAFCITHDVPMELVETRAHVLESEEMRRSCVPMFPAASFGEAIVTVDVAERAGWWKE